MNAFRRDFLKLAGTGLAGAATSAVITPGARAGVTAAPIPAAGTSSVYDVRPMGQLAMAKPSIRLRSIRRLKLLRRLVAARFAFLPEPMPAIPFG